MKSFYRPTWIEVDLDAIKHNVEVVQRANPGKEIFAVIKANAYGHGDVEVARAALQAGAKWLAVSSLDEGIHLREAGVEAPILILGVIEVEDTYVAMDYDLSVTALSSTWIEKISLIHYRNPLKVHLKLNTGMNRLGLENGELLKTAISQLKKNPTIQLEGLFTHFATADDDDPYFFEKQLEMFHQLTQDIPLDEFRYVHLSNTASLLQHSFEFANGIRLGIGLYGINPIQKEVKGGLNPALTLYSRLTQVRWLNKNEKVGYGFTYMAVEGHWMGVVPIGYADGWWRRNQGRSVIIEGIECPIIGRVCMDQLMVQLPHPFEVGTRVTLIGESMSLNRVAEELETIPYEILCSLSDRIPRIYLSSEKQVSYNSMRFSR